MSRRAAVVFLANGGMHCLPADTVRRIITRPAVSPVPASGLGLSFVQGRVAATVELGSGPHALLCDHDSDAVTLSGVTVQQVGFFDTEDGYVLWQDERLADFDVEQCLVASLSSTTSGAAE